MEDKNIQEPVVSELPTQGSGSILATERKKQNKTVEEIADLLNLSVHQIRTIELDQGDGLPEATYVRGYIRSYANLLGLDAEDVLKSFLHPNWQQARRLDDMSWGNSGVDDASSFTSGRSVFRWGVLSTLIIAGGIAWYFGLLDGFLGQQQQTITTNVAAQTADDAGSNAVANQTTPSSPAVGSVDEQTAQGVDLSIALEDLPEGESALVNEGADVNAGENLDELVLNFSQTSWVDIRDEADARLAYKSYVAGEQLVVSSAGAMSVFIGTAEAVSVELNGEAFDIEPYREGVYAKFVVNDQ